MSVRILSAAWGHPSETVFRPPHTGSYPRTDKRSTSARQRRGSDRRTAALVSTIAFASRSCTGRRQRSPGQHRLGHGDAGRFGGGGSNKGAFVEANAPDSSSAITVLAVAGPCRDTNHGRSPLRTGTHTIVLDAAARCRVNSPPRKEATKRLPALSYILIRPSPNLRHQPSFMTAIGPTW